MMTKNDLDGVQFGSGASNSLDCGDSQTVHWTEWSQTCVHRHVSMQNASSEPITTVYKIY